MRLDRRHTRVYDMITAPEIPRLVNGGVALCHFCQRDIYWAGGFFELLIRNIEWRVRFGKVRRVGYGPVTQALGN